MLIFNIKMTVHCEQYTKYLGSFICNLIVKKSFLYRLFRKNF